MWTCGHNNSQRKQIATRQREGFTFAVYSMSAIVMTIKTQTLQTGERERNSWAWEERPFHSFWPASEFCKLSDPV